MPIGYSGRIGFPNKTMFFRGEKVADFFRQTGSDGLKWAAGHMWRFLDIKHKEWWRELAQYYISPRYELPPPEVQDSKLKNGCEVGIYPQLFLGVKMMISLFSNFPGRTLFGNRTFFSWFCWPKVSRCFMEHNDQVGVKSPVFFSRKLTDNALPVWCSFSNKDI